jgi:hypothetical protein
MNFCFFFNAIGQKVLSEEALESLEKRHYETLCFLLHPVLRPNRMLIVCVPSNQGSTHTIQKMDIE